MRKVVPDSECRRKQTNVRLCLALTPAKVIISHDIYEGKESEGLAAMEPLDEVRTGKISLACMAMRRDTHRGDCEIRVKNSRAYSVILWQRSF